MSTKSTLTVALLTLTAGAVLGLMLAPSSGKDTRKKLMKKASGVKDALDCLVEEATDRLSEIKRHAKEAQSHARDMASEARSTVRSATGV
jgi:gas vesicle protein